MSAPAEDESNVNPLALKPKAGSPRGDDALQRQGVVQGLAQAQGCDGPTTSRRLIESTFPLKQASLDSVHEKSVRHGHISTLHIWPARRPLAASRAALLATLLPEPRSAKERREMLRRMAGRVVDKTDRDGEVTGETTDGGILHWGRESGGKPRAQEDELPNAALGNVGSRFHPLARFREEIKDAFRGRPPRVLDPFAGGGAIPLEAMRLGCEVVASDLNAK